MKTIIKMAPLVGAMALLAACGTTMEQRAATGAIGGAVAGQVIGGNTGSTVAGAAIGGVAGAATTPRRPN
jgi:osmotically inducible lipoprotein OsmB